VEECKTVNLATAIALYATAAGTGSEGSSLVNNNAGNDLRVKDIARRRLVKTNPDVDANSPDSQTDNAAFTGKKYRVQDKTYGHYISEHDSTESAETAATARPYSRVLRHPELSQVQQVRDMTRKAFVKKHHV
jgi:hypothetical protein